MTLFEFEFYEQDNVENVKVAVTSYIILIKD